MRKWRIEDSEELYNIKGWGIGYYGINQQGNVYASPVENGPEIDLKELIDDLQLRDVNTPVLLRFPDILYDRMKHINECFDMAQQEYDYKGNYYTVYPIKVNQQRAVVEEVLANAKELNIGLEAGSKPELHAVLAVANNPDALIICNGYKDEDYIELALLATKMGKNLYLVVEKLNELKRILKLARRLKVRPKIGIRIKLASSGSGKWEDSGGDQSKFGLNASELLEAVDILKQSNQLDYLELIHFHIGSQITKIRKIKNAMREAAQFYVQLCMLGCKINFVDIGGGLGVDYDGTKSSSPSSINYTLQEYINDTVFQLMDGAEKNEMPHPNIITESGRSLTAHHCVLVFDVLEAAQFPEWDDDENTVNEENHELVQELYDVLKTCTSTNVLEAWHDALEIREESLDLFSLGMVPLKTRALIERLFWTIARKVNAMSDEMKHVPEEFRKLPKMLSDKYFCNFSLFQSLPDSWAIDQIFPIMPIHRLNSRPTRNASLQDITCDSDGKIEHFIGPYELSKYLSVHRLVRDEKYYLGVFLVGAYQEILGDLHNLFGDTNIAHISVHDSSFKIDKIIDGETVSEVLGYVQYNSKSLVRTLEKWVSKAVKDGKISANEGKEFLSNYRSGLYGYTYLE